MPVVDYGNNITRTFGTNLPIPYVNKVILTTNSINATVSLYFSLNVEDDIDTYLSDMQELNVYVVPVVDAQLATAEQMIDVYGLFIDSADMDDTEAMEMVYGAGYDAIDHLRRTTKAHNVIKEGADILRYVSGLNMGVVTSWIMHTIPLFEPYVTPSSYTSPVGDEYDSDQLVLLLPQISSLNETTWAYQLDLADFTLVSEEVQESGASTIYKFNADVELQFASTVGWDDETAVNTYVLEALKADLSLFCFSTPLELNGEEFFDTIKPAALEANGLSELYRSSLSPLSYQNVLENGAVIDQKATSYQYSSGISFYGIPIQALDGTYHDTDPVFLQKLTDSFRPMLGRVAETDFQQAINNLAFIIATYKNTPEFLLKLNEFRATFYDKSGQTSVSRWFDKVSNTILRTNSEVMSRAPLTRLLMSRRVIVDKRAPTSAGYSAPELVGLSSMRTDYVYMKEALIHRNGIFNSELGQAMENFQSGEHYTSLDQGYFLFDYEKAIRTTSELSKVFDIQKVEAIVGRDILHGHFLLKSAVLDRYCWTDAVDRGFTGTRSFPEEKTTSLAQLQAIFNDLFYWEEAPDEGSPPASYPELLEIRQYAFDSEYEYSVRGSYTITVDGTAIEYLPSLLLRNFNTLNGTLSDYRMMCFEFTQILESDGGYNLSPRDDDILYATITCRDATKYIASDLIMQYVRSLAEMEKYLALAQEYCSYDSTAEVFNDFFIEYINAQYEDTATAPWVIYPLIYNLHLDLVTDVWGGDMDRIVAESIKITDLISPESGRLENLEDFTINYQDFASEFYLDGAIARRYRGLESESTKEYGGNRNIYWPLPKVDFMDLYQSYTSEDATTDAATQARNKAYNEYQNIWKYLIDDGVVEEGSSPDGLYQKYHEAPLTGGYRNDYEDQIYDKLFTTGGFIYLIRQYLAEAGASFDDVSVWSKDGTTRASGPITEETSFQSIIRWIQASYWQYEMDYPDNPEGESVSGRPVFFGSPPSGADYQVWEIGSTTYIDASNFKGASSGDMASICVFGNILQNGFTWANTGDRAYQQNNIEIYFEYC